MRKTKKEIAPVKEKDLQSFAKGVFTALGCQFGHFPNYVSRVINGKFTTFVVNRDNTGWPDCIILGPNGRYLLIELKTEDGKMSQEQTDFEYYCKKHGHPHMVLRTIYDIEHIAREFVK